MTQPVTAGTSGDPLAEIVTDEITVNGQTVTQLVGLCFDTANSSNGVVRFDGTGSTNGITDGTAKVLVNGTAKDIDSAEWIDASGTSHTVDSWEKVTTTTFTVTITGTSSPVAPGDTLDVTADISNTGNSSGTQTITLEIDNGVGQVDSTSTTVSSGGTVTKTLQWAVPSGQTQQQYTATVSSNDDTATETVTVDSVPAGGVARLTFDTADTSSSTALDVWNNYDGTIQGATTGVSGANQTYTTNEAYEFDGSSDSVEIPGTPDFSGGAFTLAVWARPDDLSKTATIAGQDDLGGARRNQRIMTSQNTSGGIETIVFNGTSNIEAYIPPSKLSNGNWYHIVGIFDHTAGDTKIYLDGSLEDSSGFGSSSAPGLTDMQVGTSDTGGAGSVFFDGRIDDVRVYNKALTATEISNLYNSGSI